MTGGGDDRGIVSVLSQAHTGYPLLVAGWSAMALARVRLLDRFCFEYDDAPLVLPAALERLVAFLALRGPSRRCFVAGTLWPEVSEEHALASLRTSIWRMNRLAPGLLSATGGIGGGVGGGQRGQP